jgi:hypothetical protein
MKKTRFASTGEGDSKKRKAQSKDDKKKKRRKKTSSTVSLSRSRDENRLCVSFVTKGMQIATDLMEELGKLQKTSSECNTTASLLQQEVTEKTEVTALVAAGKQKASELRGLIDIANERTRALESAASSASEAVTAAAELLQHMHENTCDLVDFGSNASNGEEEAEEGEEEEREGEEEEGEGEEEEVEEGGIPDLDSSHWSHFEIEEVEDNEEVDEFNDVSILAKRLKSSEGSSSSSSDVGQVFPSLAAPLATASSSSSAGALWPPGVAAPLATASSSFDPGALLLSGVAAPLATASSSFSCGALLLSGVADPLASASSSFSSGALLLSGVAVASGSAEAVASPNVPSTGAEVRQATLGKREREGTLSGMFARAEANKQQQENQEKVNPSMQILLGYSDCVDKK